MAESDSSLKYLEMAANLGNAVRESEASIRLADAAAAYADGLLSLDEYQRTAQEYDDFAESVVQMLEMTIFGATRAKGCGGGCCSGR